MSLVRKVEHTIEEEGLFERGETIIVAVSGGPDSVALLLVLHELSRSWQWTMIVAHADHGFRGEESRQEAHFVRDLAKRLGLRFELAELKMPDKLVSSESIQAAARRERYRFLSETAQQYEARSIALGHHAGDVAETVLMRVISGTGLTGLRGIPIRYETKKVQRVRPLLRIYKAEVITFLESRGQAYCQDSSNLKRDYVRNRIRLDLLPMLTEYNPRVEEALVRLADAAQADDELLAIQAEAAFQELVQCAQAECVLDRNKLAKLHVSLQRRVIQLILYYLSKEPDSRFTAVQVESVREAVLQTVKPSMQLDLPAGIRLIREYDHVVLSNTVERTALLSEPELSASVKLELTALPDRMKLQESYVFSRLLSLQESAALLPRLGAWELLLDVKQVAWPLVLRHRLHGDRIALHGLNGSKKVKDMLIDLKVPPSKRDQLLLLVDARGQVLWVAGLRRSSLGLLDSSTEQVLYLKLTPDPSCMNTTDNME